MKKYGEKTLKEIIFNLFYGIFSLWLLFVFLPFVFRWLLEKYPSATSMVTLFLLLGWVSWLIIIVPIIAIIIAIKQHYNKK